MNLEEIDKKMWTDFKNQPLQFVKTTNPDQYREMALLASQTLPNQNIGELLNNAEKIERWLMEPEIKRRVQREEIVKLFAEWGEQKSPEIITPEASDGVSGD